MSPDLDNLEASIIKLEGFFDTLADYAKKTIVKLQHLQIKYLKNILGRKSPE
jgi:hypothetical protein